MPKPMQVVVVDDLSPEVIAMVQALYSRDPRSILDHLEDVKKRGADKFMARFYVGYGHKSIGDCGTTTLGIEQVSMLVAKAVQDTPLYNGQEASTRYLDMTTQDVRNPLGTEQGESVQKGWMALYADVLAALIASFGQQFPKKPEEKQDVWENAIRAKAFDIARGLLPGGATTLLSWHVNLRQAYDHAKEMRNHVLPEVRAAAEMILGTLKKKYPPSFSHEINDAEESYIAQSMRRFSFFFEPITEFSYSHNLDLAELAKEQTLLSTRPPRTELHQRFRRFGNVTFKFPLDFGSYRDIQRQRSAVQEMPLLTTRLGFHPWYLAGYPEGTAERIEKLQKQADQLDADDATRQYYIPMGFQVPVVVTCTLPSAVYVSELRSGTTVHPTLRMVAQQMGNTLEQIVPGLVMHHNRTALVWNVKRGTQTIVARN